MVAAIAPRGSAVRAIGDREVRARSGATARPKPRLEERPQARCPAGDATPRGSLPRGNRPSRVCGGDAMPERRDGRAVPNRSRAKAIARRRESPTRRPTVRPRPRSAHDQSRGASRRRDRPRGAQTGVRTTARKATKPRGTIAGPAGAARRRPRASRPESADPSRNARDRPRSGRSPQARRAPREAEAGVANDREVRSPSGEIVRKVIVPRTRRGDRGSPDRAAYAPEAIKPALADLRRLPSARSRARRRSSATGREVRNPSGAIVRKAIARGAAAAGRRPRVEGSSAAIAAGPTPGKRSAREGRSARDATVASPEAASRQQIVRAAPTGVADRRANRAAGRSAASASDRPPRP